MGKSTDKTPKASPAKKRPAKKNWRSGIDFFRFEERKLERDLHTVVIDSLEAGIKQLAGDFNSAEKRYDGRLKGTSVEEENWIVDDFIDLRADQEDQERFLRNIALVALLSRLTHSLHQLAWQDEAIAARNETEYPGSNEFHKAEFRMRFAIDMPPRHIQWIEPLRKARNLIVHNGGEAHPIKYERAPSGSLKATTDKSFSKRHISMVHEDDYPAEVRITQVQCYVPLRKPSHCRHGWLGSFGRSCKKNPPG